MTYQEYLEALEGQEVRTNAYESSLGVVGITNGQVMADGEIIDPKPSLAKLKTLWKDYFTQEFGTTDLRSLI